jgi:26S proteasome regulatory subunit N7
MEIEFFIMLIYLRQLKIDLLKKHIDIQHKYLLDGGDWEKKNKLKIFEGIYCLMTREFQKASQLFLSCITTFNCPEAISYNKLVYYTIITSFISITRIDIKKKIVHSPDILTSIREMPVVKNLLDCYVKCDYKGFFVNFIALLEELKSDDFIKPHIKYYIREMRVMIYS